MLVSVGKTRREAQNATYLPTYWPVRFARDRGDSDKKIKTPSTPATNL